MLKIHQYFVYITTNKKRKTFTGVTNNLYRRLQQHSEESNRAKTFAGRYRCFHLVYLETHQYIHDAIAREKEIKGWLRAKKEALITSQNPNWVCLNDQV